MIKIANQADDGWVVAEHYKSSLLADTKEDQSCIRRAEFAAIKGSLRREKRPGCAIPDVDMPMAIQILMITSSNSFLSGNKPRVFYPGYHNRQPGLNDCASLVIRQINGETSA